MHELPSFGGWLEQEASSLWLDEDPYICVKYNGQQLCSINSLMKFMFYLIEGADMVLREIKPSFGIAVAF